MKAVKVAVLATLCKVLAAPHGVLATMCGILATQDTLGNCALMMIKNPYPPSSLGITDFSFNIPWASVLLVFVALQTSHGMTDEIKFHNEL